MISETLFITLSFVGNPRTNTYHGNSIILYLYNIGVIVYPDSNSAFTSITEQPSSETGEQGKQTL